MAGSPRAQLASFLRSWLRRFTSVLAMMNVQDPTISCTQAFKPHQATLRHVGPDFGCCALFEDPSALTGPHQHFVIGWDRSTVRRQCQGFRHQSSYAAVCHRHAWGYVGSPPRYAFEGIPRCGPDGHLNYKLDGVGCGYLLSHPDMVFAGSCPSSCPAALRDHVMSYHAVHEVVQLTLGFVITSSLQGCSALLLCCVRGLKRGRRPKFHS